MSVADVLIHALYVAAGFTAGLTVAAYRERRRRAVPLTVRTGPPAGTRVRHTAYIDSPQGHGPGRPPPLDPLDCDGGTPGGFFPTACGRDEVHPRHPLGRPPLDTTDQVRGSGFDPGPLDGDRRFTGDAT